MAERNGVTRGDLLRRGSAGAFAVAMFGGLAEQRFLEASVRGWSEEDMAALVRLWEEAAGQTVSEAGTNLGLSNVRGTTLS